MTLLLKVKFPSKSNKDVKNYSAAEQKSFLFIENVLKGYSCRCLITKYLSLEIFDRKYSIMQNGFIKKVTKCRQIIFLFCVNYMYDILYHINITDFKIPFMLVVKIFQY